MELHSLAATGDSDTRRAARTGERNTQLQHFGPTNVALWRVALSVECGDGPRIAEMTEATPIPVETLNSPVRTANLSLDLARAWAQAEGDRDAHAVRYLDTADRAAPGLVRNHPLARELLAELYGRAKRRAGNWTASATGSAATAATTDTA